MTKLELIEAIKSANDDDDICMPDGKIIHQVYISSFGVIFLSASEPDKCQQEVKK